MNNRNNSLSIYIHIPFCINRCNYCDFYSNVCSNYSQIESYIGAITKEIDCYNQYLNKKNIESLYIGGGTPSLVKISDIKKIVKCLLKYVDLGSLKEFTIEMNPEHVNRNYLEQLREIGVNRISVGVQSLFKGDLDFIGRRKMSRGIDEVVEDIKKVFNNFSLDFILGLPKQKAKDIVQFVKKHGIPHVSLYMLTLYENTMLYQKYKDNLDIIDDKNAKDYNAICEFFSDNNYFHYEISNFVINKRFISLHNYRYWENKDYLGFGAGAAGFYEGTRYVNKSKLSYIESGFNNRFQYVEKLSKKEMMEESIMLGLRTIDGIDRKKFEKTFDFDIGFLLYSNSEMVNKFEITNDKVILKKDKILFFNDIVSELLLFLEKCKKL